MMSGLWLGGAPVLVPVGLDIQQREGAEHAWQTSRRGLMQIRLVQLLETGDAKQAESADHLVLEQFQHADDPVFASRGKRPALQPADADEIRARGDRLDDVGAAAE